MVQVMRLLARLGVDGFRLDAIRISVEREGTNYENLPETHAVMKDLRQHLDCTSAPACCWPKPINGRKMSARISATATNATWRFISR